MGYRFETATKITAFGVQIAAFNGLEITRPQHAERCACGQPARAQVTMPCEVVVQLHPRVLGLEYRRAHVCALCFVLTLDTLVGQALV